MTNCDIGFAPSWESLDRRFSSKPMFQLSNTLLRTPKWQLVSMFLINLFLFWFWQSVLMKTFKSLKKETIHLNEVTRKGSFSLNHIVWVHFETYKLLLFFSMIYSIIYEIQVTSTIYMYEVSHLSQLIVQHYLRRFVFFTDCWSPVICLLVICEFIEFGICVKLLKTCFGTTSTIFPISDS